MPHAHSRTAWGCTTSPISHWSWEQTHREGRQGGCCRRCPLLTLLLPVCRKLYCW